MTAPPTLDPRPRRRLDQEMKAKPISSHGWDGKDWILSKNKIDYPEGAFVGFADNGNEPIE